MNEPLGVISPNIYGHFTENIGALIYDGVWVGEGSKIPNIGGLRRDLVERLRLISPPIVRWPGGCFADSYDWRDGVGPKQKRPRRTNFWGGSGITRQAEKFDPNEFGTAEFARFCKLIGAQPYLAANVRSLPAEQFYQWIEYANSPAGSTTYSEMRAADGSAQPFPVLYWGVGNEAWGCGGDFTPEEYATEWRRFVAWVPRYGEKLRLIASGPSDTDWDWTRGFLEGVAKKGAGLLKDVYGLSVHHYSWNVSRGKTTDWNKGKGDAVDFAPVDWYELLRQGADMEAIITGHWKVMGEIDREHAIKLAVDEWGPWYKPGSSPDPNYVLGQQVTLRDAVLSAMTLDIFNRHPDKVAIACNAQLMNCLNSLFFSEEEKLIVTPVYHVFRMYAGHQGQTAVRVDISAPEATYDRDGQTANFPSLTGSASLTAELKELTLSVVNANTSSPQEAEISIRGAAVRSATGTVLTSDRLQAHNTFAEPDNVRPQNSEVAVKGGSIVHVFPRASVTTLKISLT
ncbi:MAG: alpha-N-arabinofuranosidase [Terriglobales bacterium]